MILVCAFYAIAWLPEKILLLLIGLDQNLNYINNAYYVTVFLGFLYICANPFIYALKFDPVRDILQSLFLCKIESEPAGGSIEMNQNVTATAHNRAV